MPRLLRIPAYYYSVATLLATTIVVAPWADLWPSPLDPRRYMPPGRSLLWKQDLMRLHLIIDCMIGFSCLFNLHVRHVSVSVDPRSLQHSPPMPEISGHF